MSICMCPRKATESQRVKENPIKYAEGSYISAYLGGQVDWSISKHSKMNKNVMHLTFPN